MSDEPVRRAALWAMAAAGLAGFSLSTGVSLSVFNHPISMPMSVLNRLPAFDGIRSPARFATVGELMLATFATCGLAAALRARPKALVGTVAVVLSIAVLYEDRASIPMVRVPDDARWSAVNHLLADRPDGPVVELPIAREANGSDWPYLESPRLYLATIDHDPRVNGYSGYAPAGYDAQNETLNHLPAPDALDELHSLGVRYVILRTSIVGNFPAAVVAQLQYLNYTDAQAQAIIAGLPSDIARTAEKAGDAYLIDLQPGAP